MERLFGIVEQLRRLADGGVIALVALAFLGCVCTLAYAIHRLCACNERLTALHTRKPFHVMAVKSDAVIESEKIGGTDGALGGGAPPLPDELPQAWDDPREEIGERA